MAAATRALQGAGYCELSELAGGYRAWDLAYRPDGRRRAKGAFRDKSSGGWGVRGGRVSARCRWGCGRGEAVEVDGGSFLLPGTQATGIALRPRVCLAGDLEWWTASN